MVQMKLNSCKESETHDGRADMTNFEMDLFDTRMVNTKTDKEDECCHSSRNRGIKPACLPISIISLCIIGLVFLPLFNDEDLASPGKLSNICVEGCGFELVESIPTGLKYDSGPVHQPTHEAWIKIINSAEKFIEIAALYWNLNSTEYPTAEAGRRVYQALISAAKRGVKIRIAQDSGRSLSDNSDSAYLQNNGLALVRDVNFTSLVGSGVLHTKFIIVDLKHVYVGSANMDWKSLTEVKELGALVMDCPCFATDLYKIFAVYWRLGEEDARIPAQWPISFRTPYDAEKPLPVIFNGIPTDLYISSSPIQFNPKGREHDVDAITSSIAQAKYTVCVAVMDYIPTTLYMKENTYWPVIDSALRAAAFRGVTVRLLISRWKHSRKAELDYLKSMMDINPALPDTKGMRAKGRIEVKLFDVPSTEKQKKIPFARVNHNKYMVTDKVAYIGTSNWAGDYFITTAGVGVVMSSLRGESVVSDLQAVFDRDWNSPYATTLDLAFHNRRTEL